MKGSPAIYRGRLVSKEHFRAFVYTPSGLKKLIESWDEFEHHMASGLWFDSLKAADASKAVVIESKPKRNRNKPVKEVVITEEEPFIEEELIPVPAEHLAFEVKTKDDFLPKG